MISHFTHEEYICVIESLHKGKASKQARALYQKMKDHPECLAIVRDGWASAVRLEEAQKETREIPTLNLAKVKSSIEHSQEHSQHVAVRADISEPYDFVVQSQLHPSHVFYLTSDFINSQVYLQIKIKPIHQKKFTSVSLRDFFAKEILYIASKNSSYNLEIPAITEASLRYSLVAMDNEGLEETFLHLVHI